MRRSRFTDEQIIDVLRLVDRGAKRTTVCRRLKRLVADLCLDTTNLRDSLRRNGEPTSAAGMRIGGWS